MTPSPRVEVHPGPEELATGVAGELLKVLAGAQADGRTPHVVLTGGTIADVIHRRLAGLADGSGVDWARVVVWWGDERFVPRDSEDRNAGPARAAFLDAVGIPAENVHEMPASDGYSDAQTGAAAYAEELGAHGADEFDVVMLGVGPDGHVASLFPGFPQLSADGSTAAVADSPKSPPERITLTFDRLNRTRATWLVVSGDAKSEAVARALAPQTTTVEETPAAGVRGREETVWFLDRAAASRL